MSIGIIGAGAFGSALAVALGRTNQVKLWARGAVTPRDYPCSVTPVSDLNALTGSDAILLVIPAQKTAAFLADNPLPDAPLVFCAKGIDQQSQHIQTQVAKHYSTAQFSVLTGPGFADEIAAGLPTALTLAGADAKLQSLLSNDRLRLYLSDDLIGAQLGGALKNVIALACGMAIGAGFGESARAALLTRGFAEMQRLGVAMGAKADTFQGLSGLGDLALTCGSTKSRNFSQGLAFGTDKSHNGGTVEGLATAQAAAELAKIHHVDAPITGAVADVIAGRTTLNTAMEALLSRALKQE